MKWNAPVTSNSAAMGEPVSKACHSESELLGQIALPINHCNLPSWLLASLEFQRHPVSLVLDGIVTWHSDLFDALGRIKTQEGRGEHFTDFMEFRFRLSKNRESANWGYEPPPRPKMNYRRLVLGWLFDSDNDQGAAWRSWVESRFGLLTQFHQERVLGPNTPEYLRFRQACARAVMGTNELDTQLDLLYSYCQFELALRYPKQTHLRLYRGCAELPEYEIEGHSVKLFNNLSSFTLDPEDALRFGSKVFSVDVPLEKIACFDSLLPRCLTGEQEFMILGGLYCVEQIRV
jgi:NAD+--dinitrogen-reductase ADP-D-ribosyltransferase